MIDIYQKGIQIINDTIINCKFPKNKIIFIEGLKNFGDVLHSSVVVRHYIKEYPHHKIIWGISEKYSSQFDEYSALTGATIISLPHDATPQIRQEWKRYNFNIFKSIFPLCAVSGFDIAGNIVDNVLYNAGINKLSVPKKPYFPHGINDYQWHDQFCIKYGLKSKKYIVLEYNSYTLSKPPHNITWPIDKYDLMLKGMMFPVVWTAAKDDPPLEIGIDARGITWRQAKVMIERCGCVIGCGSGIGVLSCCEGLNPYILEINIGEALSLKNIYNANSESIRTDNPLEITNIVNGYITRLNSK